MHCPRAAIGSVQGPADQGRDGTPGEVLHHGGVPGGLACSSTIAAPPPRRRCSAGAPALTTASRWRCGGSQVHLSRSRRCLWLQYSQNSASVMVGDDTCGLISRCRRLADTLRQLLGGNELYILRWGLRSFGSF